MAMQHSIYSQGAGVSKELQLWMKDRSSLPAPTVYKNAHYQIYCTVLITVYTKSVYNWAYSSWRKLAHPCPQFNEVQKYPPPPPCTRDLTVTGYIHKIPRPDPLTSPSPPPRQATGLECYSIGKEFERVNARQGLTAPAFRNLRQLTETSRHLSS